jgi:CRISPR-associated endoribonuclease Cas6
MRLVLELLAQGDRLILPLHYNQEVQGLIYHNLDETLARRIHDQGTPLGKRQFRFFTFSRLLGEYRIDGDIIEFSGPVRLHIGSVHEELLESLAFHMLREPLVRLGGALCQVRSIEVELLPKISRPILVRAISPITVYSTLKAGDGRKKTYYYSPFEAEWEEHLLANLQRKAQALGWGKKRLAALEGARIRPFKVKKEDLRVLRYRETVIKGWTGLFTLDLPEPFFFLAYDSGLGSKNSQGFGMVEVVDAPRSSRQYV